MKKKNSKKDSSEWIDVHNDTLMISLGMRLPDYEIPDFSKTDKEKAMIKKFRSTDKKSKYYSVVSKKPHKIPCYDKLIVYTRRENHNTCSYKCYQYQIKSVIDNMHPDKDKIIKFCWLGKTYYPQYTPNGSIFFTYP